MHSFFHRIGTARRVGLTALSLTLIVVGITTFALTPRRDASLTHAVPSTSATPTLVETTPLASLEATALPVPQRNPLDPDPVPQELLATLKPTPSSTLNCHNSHDQRCGDFSWNPEPAPNKKMTMVMRWEPHDVHVGEDVRFSWVAHDDTEIWSFRLGFGDGEATQDPYCDEGKDQARYGPWTPRRPIDYDTDGGSYHTYTKEGSYEVSLTLFGSEWCYNAPWADPYRDTVTQTYTINVGPQQL